MTCEEMVECGLLNSTEATIEYCIQYLKENPQEHYSMVSEHNDGGEVVIVERMKSCSGDEYFEIKVCTLNKSSWRRHE